MYQFYNLTRLTYTLQQRDTSQGGAASKRCAHSQPAPPGFHGIVSTRRHVPAIHCTTVVWVVRLRGLRGLRTFLILCTYLGRYLRYVLRRRPRRRSSPEDPAPDGRLSLLLGTIMMLLVMEIQRDVVDLI